MNVASFPADPFCHYNLVVLCTFNLACLFSFKQVKLVTLNFQQISKNCQEKDTVCCF